MDEQQADYQSYLLRLWRVSDEENALWRASLESPHTGERRGFPNLMALFAFLEREVSHAARGQAAPRTDEKGGDADQRF